MSLARWGSLMGLTDISTSEAIQAQTDSTWAGIHGEGRKINVMSNEEWDRRQEEHKKELKEKEEKERAYREKIVREHQRSEAMEKARAESNVRIEREKQYATEIQKKLQTYHEPPEGDTTSDKEWKTVYEETSPFLAKCVIAYRYGIDKAIGKLDGELGSFFFGGSPNRSLGVYLSLRDIQVNGDEAGFENLVAQKFPFPKYLTIALIDNIGAVSVDSTQVNRKNLLKFIVEDEVTQIELEELVLEK